MNITETDFQKLILNAFQEGYFKTTCRAKMNTDQYDVIRNAPSIAVCRIDNTKSMKLTITPVEMYVSDFGNVILEIDDEMASGVHLSFGEEQ